MRICCVVPCYNEEKRLDTEAFVEFVDAFVMVDFIFVNDGSRDETLAVLERLCARRARRMRVLSLATNGGKAEAVRRGLIEAIEAGADLVGYWDADLSTPLDAIPEMVATLEDRRDIDIVIGSRVRLLGRDIERNALRHYGGRVFATLASMLLGMAVYDTQCGAKFLRVDDALRDALSEPFTVGWTFDVELFLRLDRYRRANHLRPVSASMVEMPLLKWHDIKGSKVKPTDFPRAIAELARLRLRYRDRG